MIKVIDMFYIIFDEKVRKCSYFFFCKGLGFLNIFFLI